MRVVRHTYTATEGGMRQTAKWYIDFRDHHRIRRRVPAFRSRRASEEMGRKLEKLAEHRGARQSLDRDLRSWVEGLPESTRRRLATWGLLEECELAGSLPLETLLDEYAAHLRGKGGKDHHVRQSRARVCRVLNDGPMRVASWSDLTPRTVEAFLRQLEEKHKSGATRNAHLAAVRSFARWMVRTGRAVADPLESLRKVRTTPTRERRALSTEEQRRLVETTWSGPVRWEMDGPTRAAMYALAMGTGLRAGEIRQLRVVDLELEGEAPLVRARASTTKNAEEAVLPLTPGLAQALLSVVRGRLPAAPAFQTPRRWRQAEMLREDLAAAKIDAKDEAERVVDFHALRATFVTALARANAPVATTQRLARHSTPHLTLNVYTKLGRDDERKAVSTLPDFYAPGTEALQATGTDGAGPRTGPSSPQGQGSGSLQPVAGTAGYGASAARHALRFKSDASADSATPPVAGAPA